MGMGGHAKPPRGLTERKPDFALEEGRVLRQARRLFEIPRLLPSERAWRGVGSALRLPPCDFGRPAAAVNLNKPRLIIFVERCVGPSPFGLLLERRVSKIRRS
jgi:hypothetical protein